MGHFLLFLSLLSKSVVQYSTGNTGQLPQKMVSFVTEKGAIIRWTATPTCCSSWNSGATRRRSVPGTPTWPTAGWSSPFTYVLAHGVVKTSLVLKKRQGVQHRLPERPVADLAAAGRGVHLHQVRPSTSGWRATPPTFYKVPRVALWEEPQPGPGAAAVREGVLPPALE